MSTKYFSYLFARYKYIYLIILIIFLLIFPFYNFFTTNNNQEVLVNSTKIVTALLVIIGYILPYLTLYKKFNKDKYELVSSLPIDNIKLYKTSLLFHLIFTISIFILASSLNIIFLIIRKIDINYSPLILYSIYMLFIYLTIYSFSSFILSICNSYFESIIIHLAYLALPILLILTNYVVFNNQINFATWDKFSFLGLSNSVTNFYIRRTLSNFNQPYSNQVIIYLLPFFIYIFLALTVTNIKKIRLDKINTISKNFFTYNFLLTIYSFFLLMIGNYTTGFLNFIFIFLLVIAAYFIYYYFMIKNTKIIYLLIIEILIIVITANILVFYLQQGIILR